MVSRYLDCRLVKVNAGYAYALASVLPDWRMKLLGHEISVEISVAKILWPETAVAKSCCGRSLWQSAVARNGRGEVLWQEKHRGKRLPGSTTRPQVA